MSEKPLTPSGKGRSRSVVHDGRVGFGCGSEDPDLSHWTFTGKVTCRDCHAATRAAIARLNAQAEAGAQRALAGSDDMDLAPVRGFDLCVNGPRREIDRLFALLASAQQPMGQETNGLVEHFERRKFVDSIERLKVRVDQEKAEAVRLRELLEAYGAHKSTCPAVPHRNHALGPCGCGWDSIAFEDPRTEHRRTDLHPCHGCGSVYGAIHTCSDCGRNERSNQQTANVSPDAPHDEHRRRVRQWWLTEMGDPPSGEVGKSLARLLDEAFDLGVERGRQMADAPDTLDLRTEIVLMAEALEREECSHTDVANWLLSLAEGVEVGDYGEWTPHPPVEGKK